MAPPLASAHPQEAKISSGLSDGAMGRARRMGQVARRQPRVRLKGLDGARISRRNMDKVGAQQRPGARRRAPFILMMSRALVARIPPRGSSSVAGSLSRPSRRQPEECKFACASSGIFGPSGGGSKLFKNVLARVSGAIGSPRRPRASGSPRSDGRACGARRRRCVRARARLHL